jgi:SSS family solute:Na+ symporter
MMGNMIDPTILVIYLVIILGVGVYFGRKKKETSADYFKAEKKLPWFVIGASFVATGMNTEQMVGMVGMAYKHGIVVANWDWIFFPIYTLLIWVFLPIYLRGRVSTIPEYLENRFNPACRNVLAIVVVLGYVFINLSTVLYAGALIIERLIGFPLLWGILALALIAVIHVALGGLETVAWVNLLQFGILICGGFLLFLLGLNATGMSWSEVVGDDPIRASLIQPINHPIIPWTAVVICPFTVGIWYSCTNQFLVQQCLGAKKEWDARMGIVLAGFVTIFRPLIEIFPGMIAHKLFVLENPDHAFAALIDEVIPVGLKGIVVAGILAAVLSTIESILNATSTVFTLDIYKKFFDKTAVDKKLVRVGRITMIAVMLIAVCWAPQISKFGSIFEYFQKFVAYIASPMAAVFLMGMLWKRTNSTAAITVMVVGIPISFVLEKILPADMNFFNLAAITWAICIVLLAVISLATKAPGREKIEGMLWHKSMLKLLQAEGGSVSFYKAPWFWWTFVGVIVAAIYVVYW